MELHVSPFSLLYDHSKDDHREWVVYIHTRRICGPQHAAPLVGIPELCIIYSHVGVIISGGGKSLSKQERTKENWGLLLAFQLAVCVCTGRLGAGRQQRNTTVSRVLLTHGGLIVNPSCTRAFPFIQLIFATIEAVSVYNLPYKL